MDIMERLPHTDITRSELQSLADRSAGPCVTVYLPLERRYPQSADNPAHLRDVLDRTARRLREWGLTKHEAEELLRPGRELEHESELARAGASDGLAVLIAPAFQQAYRLPYSCPESVDVGETFYLAPLMRMLTWPVEFYLLALSGNGVRLYRASRDALVPVELPPDVPRSLEAYTAGMEIGRAVRFQSTAGVGSAGGSVGLVHGQTSPKDDAKIRLEEYVQAVAKRVGPVTVQNPLPVVLAAVQALHAPFRAAYTGPDLVEPGIHGSPDELTEAEMHGEAVRLVEQQHAGELRTACQRFGRAADKGRASRSLEEIVPAATEGRIDSIIAALGHRAWGRWDAQARRVSVAEVVPGGDGRLGQIDVLDLALREALRHGGTVSVVPPEQVPDGAPAVAALRWTPSP